MHEAVLFAEVPVPEEFVAANGLTANHRGGDLRIGDLTGDGNVDFLLYRSLAGIKPAFFGAFDLAGAPLWSLGDKNLTVSDADGEGDLFTTSPDRPGPVVLFDIDGDGSCEVVCFAIEPGVERTSKWDCGDVGIAVLNGATGQVEKRVAPGVLADCTSYVDGESHIPNFVHQRLLAANLRGGDSPRDVVVKIGTRVLAFDDQLELLWQYEVPWYRYGEHSAYIPAVGDLDGDGRDEVTGGHYGLDHDGTVLWERYSGDNMDSVLIDSWPGRGDRRVAILSAGAQIVDGRGTPLLQLGLDEVPHGQEIRIGRFRDDAPKPQLVVRYAGHAPRLLLSDAAGVVLERFEVDDSPNNTGLETVRWNGAEGPDLIYSPAALFDGRGQRAVCFPGLPPPTGGKMGWYHCFPADVCGDERDEVILYDPYSDRVFIYTPDPFLPDAFDGYQHTPRQYNARLLD